MAMKSCIISLRDRGLSCCGFSPPKQKIKLLRLGFEKKSIYKLLMLSEPFTAGMAHAAPAGRNTHAPRARLLSYLQSGQRNSKLHGCNCPPRECFTDQKELGCCKKTQTQPKPPTQPAANMLTPEHFSRGQKTGLYCLIPPL